MLLKINRWSVIAILSVIIIVFVGVYERKLELWEFSASRPLEEKIRHPVITGYFQDAKSITILFNQINMITHYITLFEVPVTIGFLDLIEKASQLEINNGQLRLSIENEPNTKEYSIIIFFEDGNYLELVRQSSVWLKKSFNYNRIGGYTILGRRSIGTKFSESSPLPSLVFKKRPKPMKYSPAKISQFNEINQAIGLLKKIWSQRISTGPSLASYDRFLEQNFEDKMRQLSTGEMSVSCQGFRDLFLHASTVATNPIKLRPVEAFNYYPQIPDLINYGHSTAEIWVESLGKWVIFDPWLAITVTKNNIPVSADELSNASNANEYKVVPLMESISRVRLKGDGTWAIDLFQPSTVRLEEFTCMKLGCSPGYMEYFRRIEHREYTIVH